jgi:predicted regulator of Ras-like GTPase activity (Roadblock/LC7/MglB family)
MTTRAVEGWIQAPLARFVEDARVTLALLLLPSGQVLAEHGFTRSLDVASACALAAAIHASGGELGRMLDGRAFSGLHHAGEDRQTFLAEANTPRGAYIFLTVFDRESSLGLVRLYFDEFVANLAAAAPDGEAPSETVLAEHFERDLNRNLAALFGRA